MFSEFWHTRVGFFKICIFNCACYTSIFTIFKETYVLNRVYAMALCSGHSFFVLWHSHTLFSTWVFHHGTMWRVHSLTLYDLDLWSQYQNCIFTMDFSLARCLCSLTYAYMYQILAYGCITTRQHFVYILTFWYNYVHALKQSYKIDYSM